MKRKESMKFIHYGSDSFDINRVKLVQNQPLSNKPIGGFWATPVGAELGWKEWCEEVGLEMERLKSHFEFTLSEDAKVIEISKEEDTEALPLYIEKMAEKMMRLFGDAFRTSKPIDFEKLVADGVDAILFNLSADCMMKYGALSGWDCDSLLVLNPKVIITE